MAIHAAARGLPPAHGDEAVAHLLARLAKLIGYLLAVRAAVPVSCLVPLVQVAAEGGERKRCCITTAGAIGGA